MMDIVCRTASISALERILFFMELGQRGFCKSGGGTQQRDDPHPEYSSGAAGGNGRNYSDQITHAHPCGSGYDQRLKSGYGIFFRYVLLFRGDPKHFRKETEGQKTGPYSEIDAGGDKDEDEK